jgi:hypothetical protein
MNPSIRSDRAPFNEAGSGEMIRQASSYSFLTRLLRRSKPYLLPLVILDGIVVYYFSLHISFAQAANSLVEAIGSFHPQDPRAEAVIADAQAQLTKSILSLLAAAGGAILCMLAVAGLCWSARCLRKSRRMAAEIAGTLWIDGERTAVRVVDISERGCRISLDVPLHQGSAVRLSFGDSEASAKVVWTSTDQAGLQFSAPLVDGLPPPAQTVTRDLRIAGYRHSPAQGG